MSAEDAEDPIGRDDLVSERDEAVLNTLRTVLEEADPMPAGLVDRVRFALELDALDVELARLVEVSQLVGARSDEFTRLVTFQSDSLTIMITLDFRAGGTTRVDGWLSPGARHRIELRCPTGTMATESDEAGRFALDGVPAGSTQLVVHGVVPDAVPGAVLDVDGSHRVVTPPIEIGKGGLSP